MDDLDRQAYIKRYEERLEKHGYSPSALGWGKGGRQKIRFAVLSELILEDPVSSVLDVGCGFADLYEYLLEQGWQGTYKGIDIVPGLLGVAAKRHPQLTLQEMDIGDTSKTLGQFDYIVASGIFNAKLHHKDNLLHIEETLTIMHRHARKAVCVDFMSTYVDFQHPSGWHTDPSWALQMGKKLSKRVTIRHDYMPYEYALLIYCDDSISSQNVFQAV